MGFSNNMTKLLNKIENRLGMKILMPHLPESIQKDKWPEDVIIPDTLTEFSRYFPNQIYYPISRAHPQKDGWYIIDEDFIEGIEILGIRDIDWSSFTNDSLYFTQETGMGSLDMVAMQSMFNMEDIATIQMKKDINSLFNNGIYVDYKAPNMFKLTMSTNTRVGLSMQKFNIILLTKHADNLLTISPTMMSLFEKLAIADVAGYLYRELKYFDGLEGIYATIDLKLDELQEHMSRRDSIIEKMEESFVSASNDAAPIILTI